MRPQCGQCERPVSASSFGTRLITTFPKLPITNPTMKNSGIAMTGSRENTAVSVPNVYCSCSISARARAPISTIFCSRAVSNGSIACSATQNVEPVSMVQQIAVSPVLQHQTTHSFQSIILVPNAQSSATSNQPTTVQSVTPRATPAQDPQN